MAQVEQCRDLPEEVWKVVLLKLWLNEEDLGHLLTCRKVCSLWKKLVDQMPTKPTWNPWLEHGLYDYNAVDHSFATIIHYDTDIRLFLSGNFELGKNPFRNHTLNFFLGDVKKENKNVLKIIKDHGEHVWKFLFRPNNHVPGSLTNFPHLLTYMKNIRTLLWDCRYLSRKQYMAIDGKDFPKDLNKLRELVLYEECQGNDFDTDDLMISKLSVNYGIQIKSITINSLILRSNRSSILDKFPNLEDLKVERFITWPVVFELPPRKQWPKLKRLAIRNWWGGSIEVKNMLMVASCFAETLQLLSLETNFFMEKPVGEVNQEDDAVVITTFPKLTQLIIPFRMMRHQGELVNIPLETRFRFSFPNLKSLVFEDTKNEFKDRDIGGAELEEICAPFWPLVPSSVETISVRSKKTNQVLHQDFPVVYKCKRNEASGLGR